MIGQGFPICVRRIRKITRRLLRIGLFAGAMGLLLTVGLNAYLQTDGGLRRLSGHLERLFGSPVRAGKASVSPFGTVTIRALSVGAGMEGVASSGELASLKARWALLPLLRGKLRLIEIRFEGMRLRIVERPPDPVMVASGMLGDPQPESERPPPHVSIPPIPAPGMRRSASPSGLAKSEDPRRTPERFSISDAEIVAYAMDGVTERFRIRGLAVEGESGADDRIRGTVGFQAFQGPLGLEVFGGKAQLAIDGGTVVLSNASAVCEDGVMTGGLVMQPGTPGVPFRFAVSTDGINVANLPLNGEGVLVPLTEGKIVGALVAEGRLQALEQVRLRLAGHLEGGLLAISPRNRLAGVIGIEGTGRASIDRAEIAVLYSGGQGHLESATFQSGALLVKSNGSFTKAGAICLSLRPYLGQGHGEGPAIAACGLPPFSRLEGTDWFFRDFLLEGTIGAPLIGLSGDRTAIPVGEFIEGLASRSAGGEAAAEIRWRPVSESIVE